MRSWNQSHDKVLNNCQANLKTSQLSVLYPGTIAFIFQPSECSSTEPESASPSEPGTVCLHSLYQNGKLKSDPGLVWQHPEWCSKKSWTLWDWVWSQQSAERCQEIQLVLFSLEETDTKTNREANTLRRNKKSTEWKTQNRRSAVGKCVERGDRMKTQTDFFRCYSDSSLRLILSKPKIASRLVLHPLKELKPHS